MGRIERVDSEIKKQLSSVLADGVKDHRVSGMISVMSVRTDTELDQAKVYVSVYGADPQEVVAGLNSAAGYIRARIAERIKLRAMPSLKFYYDDSVDYSIKIDKIIREINSGEERGQDR